MNNIDTNSSCFEEKEEEDDNYHETSQNDSNPMQYNKDFEYINNETYVNEFTKYNQYNFCTGKRPRNTIDYFNMNSDEYKKSKMEQKIKLMLIKLTSLTKSNIDEICYLTRFYSKKFPHKKLNTIVPIIVYKIIKKYNIKTITLKDLKNKINFSYKTYFQNEKLFSELNSYINKNTNNCTSNKINNNNNNIYKNLVYIKTPSYSELVYNSVIKHIKIIKEKSQNNLNINKLKTKKRNKKNSDNGQNVESEEKNNKVIEQIIEKFSKDENNIKELYSSPLIFELNNCQEQCKNFIFNNQRTSSDNNFDKKEINNNIINIKEEDEKKLSDENMFDDYFKDKIDFEILGLGMIKYFIDKNKIIILSYRNLKEISNCNIYQVKKSILYIKLYINYINNI